MCFEKVVKSLFKHVLDCCMVNGHVIEVKQCFDGPSFKGMAGIRRDIKSN